MNELLAVGSVDCFPWNYRPGSLSIPILVCCQHCLCTLIQSAASLVSQNKRHPIAIGIPLCLVIITLAIFHKKDIEISRSAYYQEFDVQGRFIFEADKHKGFIPTQSLLNGYWYVTSLCDIKKWMGLWCPVSLIKGLPVSGNIDQLYAYDPDRGVMARISSKIDDEISKIESIDMSRPLFGALSLENGRARWRFGPYDNGQYYGSILARPVSGYKDRRIGTVKTDLSFYIQYESPEGWTTFSPLLYGSEKGSLSLGIEYQPNNFSAESPARCRHKSRHADR